MGLPMDWFRYLSCDNAVERLSRGSVSIVIKKPPGMCPAANPADSAAPFRHHDSAKRSPVVGDGESHGTRGLPAQYPIVSRAWGVRGSIARGELQRRLVVEHVEYRKRESKLVVCPFRLVLDAEIQLVFPRRMTRGTGRRWLATAPVIGIAVAQRIVFGRSVMAQANHWVTGGDECVGAQNPFGRNRIGTVDLQLMPLAVELFAV